MNTHDRRGRRLGIAIWGAALLIAGGTVAGCSRGEVASREAGDDEVLATIDGTAITMSDINDVVGDQLAKMEYKYQTERYRLVDSALESVVRDRLLAAEAEERGIGVSELTSSAIEGVQVTEEFIAEWYESNKDRLGGRSLEELYPQIERYLWQLEQNRAVDELARRIAEDREVVYLIEPFPSDMDLEGAPALGPADAPVTLVEFSDFECPFCGKFFSTLKQIEANYADRIRIVYRQYPLNIHPNAFKAAEASLCAQDQGRFWEMHDLLFAEQDRLDVASLKEKAGRLGLGQEEFDACLDSGRHAERIRADMAEGDRLGVEGTPALFVNGVPLPGGALPYEVVAEVLDKALRRARRR